MSKAPFNLNAAIRSALRRMFARSPIIREVMNEHRRTVPRFKVDGGRHKVDAVEHQCGACGTWVPAKFISVDHIIPVIVDGFVDWNEYIQRLCCDKANLQVICDSCHQAKTNREREARTIARDNAALNELERVAIEMDPKAVRKALTKYIGKKKPEAIRQRALKLRGIFPRKGFAGHTPKIVFIDETSTMQEFDGTMRKAIV